MMTAAEGEWYHNSYKSILRHICATLSPNRILEWGPGASTLLMAQECPESHILAIEHDPIWHERHKELLNGYDNVRLWCRAIGGNGECRGYVTLPLYLDAIGQWQQPDLVFIDGRMRADCLMVARRLAHVNTVVVLHDSHRENYWIYNMSWEFCKNFDNIRTALFCSQLAAQKLKLDEYDEPEYIEKGTDKCD